MTAFYRVMFRSLSAMVHAACLFAAATVSAQVRTGAVGGAPAPSTPAAPPAPSGANVPPPALLRPPAAAGEIDLDNLAKLPYSEVIKIAQSDASQPPDATVFMLKISSKTGVPVSAIELFLDRTTSPQPLKIDANGFFSIPFNEELMKENPDMVSNQPKGTLSLEVKLTLPEPEMPKVVDGRVAYQELFAPIVTLNEAMRRVDPTFGEPGQQQFALEIAISRENVVKVRRQFGSRSLSPDDTGSVWMIFEKLLYDENPMVIVPEQAEISVRPVSAARAMDIRSR
ncbi:MAG: hypothetical protein H7A52_17760 [Akkermansiaceae bacterium]|nr:hypothetical protein [Akkermansiaceae bacterium]